MSDYYNSKRRKKRSRREKIGFYTAFSICLIAVCMAVYSTYNTVTTGKQTEITATKPSVQAVNQPVTGVTSPMPTIGMPTAANPETTQETTETSDGERKDALQTMLSTEISLTYPLNQRNILRGFSTDSIYFKTLNVWKPHLGTDFCGKLGDEVTAMCEGSVTKVYEDKMYGNTIEISINNSVCIYSGIKDICVSEGDSVSTGQKLGVIGTVPFEETDEAHIHIAVKVDDEYADPLSFIGNDD